MSLLRGPAQERHQYSCRQQMKYDDSCSTDHPGKDYQAAPDEARTGDDDDDDDVMMR